MSGVPRGLFWDVDPDALDEERHRTFIIERILMFGRPPEIRWLLDRYPSDDLRAVIRHSRRLDRKTGNFWALHFGLAQEEIACLQLPSARI